MGKITPIVVSSDSSSTEFELIPAGVYLAACYKIVDEGTHTDQYPGAKFTAKPTRRVLLYWEIVQDDAGEKVRMEDGRPFSIQKKYTRSLDAKANLRKDLNSWRGMPFTNEEAKAFEITKLLGKFCMMQIVHTPSKDGETTYANVGTIMSTKLGKDVEIVNELVSFSVDAPDQEVFNTFSDKLQERINSSEEMIGRQLTPGPRPERVEVAAPAAAPAKKAAPVVSIDEVEEIMNAQDAENEQIALEEDTQSTPVNEEW